MLHHNILSMLFCHSNDSWIILSRSLKCEHFARDIKKKFLSLNFFEKKNYSIDPFLFKSAIYIKHSLVFDLLFSVVLFCICLKTICVYLNEKLLYFNKFRLFFHKYSEFVRSPHVISYLLREEEFTNHVRCDAVLPKLLSVVDQRLCQSSSLRTALTRNSYIDLVPRFHPRKKYIQEH